MRRHAGRKRDRASRATERRRLRQDRGFAMVALLVGMSIAAIWMTAAIRHVGQSVQREREAELIFRGEQYARAIVLFQDKNQNTLPPSIDVLVEQHFLRKKWKDPITNDDFVPVGTGGLVGQPGTGGAQQPTAPQQAGRGGVPGQQTPAGAQGPVGITGVRSKSTATSIKVYQNQQQHNLWQFDAALIRPTMGRPGGAGQPGGRPNPPGGRDGGAGNRGGGAPGVGMQPGRGGTPPAGGARGGGGVPPPPTQGGRGRGLF